MRSLEEQARYRLRRAHAGVWLPADAEDDRDPGLLWLLENDPAAELFTRRDYYDLRPAIIGKGVRLEGAWTKESERA